MCLITRMRNSILIAVLLASSFQAAVGQIVEGQWTYIVENGGVTITASTATGNVTIPQSFWSSISNTWLPVVGIGQNAFQSFSYNSVITSVSIPNSVTSIGNGAFFGCASLASVSIPNRVTSIGQNAFSSCTSLASVSIPYSVTSIGNGAFSDCTSLASVSIPNSGTSIGSGAFTNSGLGSVFISVPLNSSQISQAGFPSTAVFYVGSIGAPTSMATQAQLALTQADLATTQTQLATTQAELANTKVQLENLANSDAFVAAVANKIKGTMGNYGIATQGLLFNVTSPLATKTEITTAINEGKASGIASVTASPNTWSLFTTSQIQNMAVGDLVLTRDIGGLTPLTLNYDIEQSTDLQTWTTYQALSLPLTGLPTDKAFVRIKVKK